MSGCYKKKARRLISYKINKISIKSIVKKNRFVPLSSSPIQTILSVVESHHISLRSRTSFRVWKRKRPFPSKSHRRSGISPCPEDSLIITKNTCYCKCFVISKVTTKLHFAKSLFLLQLISLILMDQL